MSGLDQARALMRGEAPRPPVSHLTGWRITQVGSGSATLTMPVSPWLRVPNGQQDMPILIETALSIAAMTGAPPGAVMRTAALSIKHFRSTSTADATKVFARARILHSGRTFTFAEVMVEDDVGRAAAHGTASLVALPIDVPQTQGHGFVPVEPVEFATPDPCARPPLDNEFPYEIWAAEPGMKIVRMMVAGEGGDFPIFELMATRLTETAEGFVAGEITPSEWFCDSTGSISTGVLASAVSIHLAGATLTLSAPGLSFGIIDQSMSFPRSVQPSSERILIRANVVSRSDEFLVTSAEATDEDGNQIAIASQTAVLRAITKHAARPEPKRTLTTVLFTDIVDSTPATERLGDARWEQLLSEHNAVMRRELRSFRGREIKSTGDGFVATFDSPARAVHCARAVRDAIRRLGIEIRAGIHTGEIDLIGDDVAGVAVVIAKRIETTAAPSEVLVSSTVRDLVSGSGLQFTEHGVHSLKGIEGDWRLYSVGS
jgi:uncharacterized protein (TIGR00369 family)